MSVAAETNMGNKGSEFRAPAGRGTLTEAAPRSEKIGGHSHLGFMSITENPDGRWNAGLLNGDVHLIPNAPTDTAELVRTAKSLFPETGKKPRIVAAALPDHRKDLGWELWEKAAISPIYLNGKGEGLDDGAKARLVSDLFHLDNGRSKSRQDELGKVHPDLLVPLEVYEKSDPKDTAMAKYFAAKLDERGKERGKKIKIVETSATEFGGGVSKKTMRVMSVLEQLDTDTSWFIQSTDDPKRYDTTKEDIHNVLQKVEEPGRGLTPEKIANLAEWGDQDFARWEEQFMDADMLVVHDPQPVVGGIIRKVREEEARRRAEGIEDKHRDIFYRQHTQPDAEAVDTPGTPQHQTWNLLWENGISQADYIIAHPLEDSIPGNIPREKVGFAGATEDRFDGLNIQLPEEVMQECRDIVDDTLRTQKVIWKDKDGNVLRTVEMHQDPIDWNGKYTLDFTRKDESKGKDHLIRHQLEYVRNEQEKGTASEDIATMVLAGYEATDDPSAAKVAIQLWDQLQGPEYDGVRQYFRLLIAPSNDFIENTLMTDASVYFLNSTKEGYETVVKSALMKGKPVISTEVGGPKLQLKPITFTEKGEAITEGRDSFLVNPRDSKQAASYLSAIYNPKDRSLYESMSEASAKHGKEPRDTTMQAVVNYLYLFHKASSGEPLPGNFAMIHEAAEAEYDEAMRKQAEASAATFPRDVITEPVLVYAN